MRAGVERWAPWLAGLVLLAGVASYAATRLTGGSSSSAPAAPTASASVPLDPEARTVAQEVGATAVARRRRDIAWRLAAPSLRGPLTLAQWRTGSIPVLPYPVGQALARYVVKDSHPSDAVLEVEFLPRKASTAQPAAFLLGLSRLDGRWRVASWSPSGAVGPGA